MIAITEGAAAFSTLKSLYDMIRQARASNDPVVLKSAIDDAYERLLTAREQVALLQEERAAALDRINVLQREFDTRVQFEKEKSGYELRWYEPGSFAYRQKSASGDEAHIPRYCQPCFANCKLSLLHSAGRKAGAYLVDFCPTCKTEFATCGYSRVAVEEPIHDQPPMKP